MWKSDLRNALVFLFGMLNACLVSAAIPGVSVNPLPAQNTTIGVGHQVAPVITDARSKSIAQRLKQTIQTIKQQPQAKSVRGQNIKPNTRLSRKSVQKIHYSKRKDGSVRQMKGGILESHVITPRVRPDEHSYALTARAFLRRYQPSLGIKNPDKELTLQKQQMDDLGRSHLKYEQRYQGLPVWPADIIVHFSPAGFVDLMNGAYAPTPRKLLSTKPRVSELEAQEMASKSLLPRLLTVDPVVKLIFYYDGSKHKLAWKVRVNNNMNERWRVIIDAISGKELLKYNEVTTAGVSGAGVDLLNQNQTLQLFEQNGTFFMLDTSKRMFDPSSTPPNPNSTRGGIFLFDAQNQDSDSDAFNLFLVSSGARNSGFLPDAVSIAAHLSEVYDYYLERHNRNSFDNNGSSLFAIVRVGQNTENAFWNGTGMFFGDGDRYAAALDVVAHEFSHGVTQESANLIYQGQSGALNEAFSDIFGEMVEARTLGRNDWDLGAVLFSGPLRNMRDPSSLVIAGLNRPYPAKMSEFISTQEDNGGVHLNSGIINFAYYQLAEGLSNAIGLRDAERIFYRALTTHLVRNSQFIDARLAAISSADELFGEDSIQRQKVAEAFDHVEIFDNVASTPPPRSIPAVSGQDATLFVCFDPSFGVNRLCRHDASLGDPQEGIFLTRFDVFANRPAVSGDGSFAAFVDSINDLCFINLDGLSDENCIGFPDTIFSVSLSPDGNFFGFISLDNNGQPENSITVASLEDNNDFLQTYTLETPAIGAETINSIAFADVMNFTADSRFVIYDALTELNLLEGSKINNWTIYALEIETGQIFSLITSSPGINIGNPSLGQTSDNFMAFAVSESEGDSSTIFTANLNTGRLEAIAEVDGVFSVPVYNGDDSSVIFDERDLFTETGFSLLSQSLQNDRMTATGASSLWLADAVFGVVYRRGVFNAPQAENAFFDLVTETLRIHAIDVVNSSGDMTTFEANLKLNSLQPLVLHLVSASVNNAEQSNGKTVFDTTTGKVILSRVSITDVNSHTQIFSVEMKLVSQNFDFEVTKLELIE